MALSTTQYGYIVDPFVPFTAPDGRTIRNGYVKVFLAGSSTPVITYANFDGTANQERIELDNSGRTAYPVIVSKGNTYKVCVYDAEHSQESPILTIDKVVPAGANVEATNIVTGLDNVESPEAGWVKSTVSGTDAEVSLDATNVTSEVDTMVKATAASADYMMPLVHKAGSNPDKKITLGNIFKFVLNFIHSLTDTATESDIASGNYFALDGIAGTKKLNSNTLLTKTAQNAKEVIQPTNREVVLNYIFANNATNPSDLNDLKSNAIYIVQRTADTTTSNFPSDFPNDSKVAILEITTAKYGSGVNAYLVSQRLTIVESGTFWTRRWTYSLGTWTTWVKVDIKSDVDSLSAKFATYREVVLNYIFANNATNPSDLNDLKSNAIYIVQRTADTTTSNFPSDFPNDSKVAILEITTAKYGSGVNAYLVSQRLTIVESGTFWTRRWSYSLGTWTTWVKVELASANKHITIGSGGDYATLREGIAEAIKIKGCLVDVLPGTYDLEVEFADALPDVYNEISKGIKLDNEIHVRFHDGAKVLANFTDGDYSEAQLEKIAIYFQPFFAKTGSFVLENLDIEATNTRYCVHDENSSVGNYFRKYLNCKMVYHNTLTNSYARFHAIGGGLGLHGTIVIDGGSYKVTTPYGNPQVNDSTGENSQMCILYHNGYAAGCESSIVIKNVYFEDRGYIKIGWWGASTIKSRVFIDGNSFGLPVLHIGQRYDAQADNFEVTEWNNEQRVQGVEWQIAPNGYEASLVSTN